jgi:hypothetical protein
MSSWSFAMRDSIHPGKSFAATIAMLPTLAATFAMSASAWLRAWEDVIQEVVST